MLATAACSVVCGTSPYDCCMRFVDRKGWRAWSYVSHWSHGESAVLMREALATGAIDATFVNHLFELVEFSRNWDDDTYNYQLIKLIVALNEQFMVSGISATAATSGAKKSAASAANTVMTVLRTRLNASKTFGENLIFMLNRASSFDAEDVCMQLLVLKLLYLLFTTKETSHYFYTNDLKVLVDIFIRELSDLPDDYESVRLLRRFPTTAH